MITTLIFVKSSEVFLITFLLENDVIFPQNLTFFFINKNIKENKAKIKKH